MEDSNLCNCACNGCVIKSKYCLTIPKLCNIDVCLNRLSELDLSSCNMIEVPKVIENLVNIRKLNLSSNELVSLPLELCKFQHLTDLILSHNKLEVVPPCLINGLGSVVVLDLSYNNILDINIKPFCIQQLMSLNVSNNLKLSSLPQWIWSIECVSLESLDISFTNCLDDIKVDPYQNMYGISKHLKHLYITDAGCNIRKLDFVKHLKNLRTIVLDNKVNDTIKKFDKLHNYFCSVPMVFNYRYKYVTSLSMNDVDMSSIGKQIYFSLPCLRFLTLANNAITLLPETLSELTNLEVLDLSKNQVLTIPDCFKNLKKLKKLLLNQNEISIFPKILNDLLNLECLDLYSNKLVAFPSWNLNSNIKSLDIEQNFFSTEKIDQNIVENYSKVLKNLRLTINEIRENGPKYDSSEKESTSDNSLPSSHWSSSSISDDNINHDEENQEDANFELEEVWECNSYEETTGLFDPKEFESSLLKEMIKIEEPLNADQKNKEKNIFLTAVRSTNEHYFCPSDELPTVISKNNKFNV